MVFQAVPVLFGLGSAYFLATFVRAAFRPSLLPPGPTPFPIFGNVLDWPRRRGWIRFKEWGQTFGVLTIELGGDVVHITLLGRHDIILNSFSAAKELLDQTSCSDRPESTMARELMGLSCSMILAPYGSEWNRMRRITRSAMSKDAIGKYAACLQTDALELIQRIAMCPEEYRAAFRLFMGKQTVRDTYGIQVLSLQDPYIKLAEDVLDQLNYAVIVGSYFVDIFPVLKYVPHWFPFAGFQSQASKACKQVSEMVNLHFDQAKRRIEEESDTLSLTSAFLRVNHDQNHKEMTTEDLEHTLYRAGVEPSTSAILLVDSILSRNDLESRCPAQQTELDGRDRAPSLDDRELPFINALINEVLRWYPPIPLGVAHRAMSTEICRGFEIPEGSIIFANLWGIGRDANLYANPEELRPERFLGPSPELDPKNWVFGFGRRSCPGLHYATSILYVCVVSILFSFDIRAPEGVSIEPEFSPSKIFFEYSFVLSNLFFQIPTG
ncbi:cytochrome P450 [Mycena floridula]|nr:cytochrome P450 [Mycena floridula]